MHTMQFTIVVAAAVFKSRFLYVTLAVLELSRLTRRA